MLHSWPAGGLPACLCLVTGHPPPSTPSLDPAPLLSHSGSRVHRGVYFNFTWWLPLKFFIFQVFSAFFFGLFRINITGTFFGCAPWVVVVVFFL